MYLLIYLIYMKQVSKAKSRKAQDDVPRLNWGGIVECRSEQARKGAYEKARQRVPGAIKQKPRAATSRMRIFSTLGVRISRARPAPKLIVPEYSTLFSPLSIGNPQEKSGFQLCKYSERTLAGMAAGVIA